MVVYEKRITLVIEGPVKNHGHLELSVFSEKVRHFFDLLNGSVKESNNKGVLFHVVNLLHSSPATVECQLTGDNISECVAVYDDIDAKLMRVKEKKTSNFSDRALSTIEQLVKVDPDKVERLEVQFTENGTVHKIYKLDDEFKNHLTNARREEERVISTIDGKLEQINIHNKANTFRIYTPLPVLSYVNCKFSQEILEKVQSSLGAFVSVSGECFYRPDMVVPYNIEVQTMKVLPPTDKLPSLRDIYGMAPDLTGDKTSEQFVREIRNEWDRDIQ